MNNLDKIVVFNCGNEEYGMSIQHVISIEKPGPLTPIPQFPSYVKGMSKIRDKVLPILDLRTVLYGFDTDPIAVEARWIILQNKDFVFGLICSQAKEIIEVSDSSMTKLGLTGYKKTEYLKGVANINGRLITIIDHAQLLHSLDGMNQLEDYVNAAKES
ncbi:chemotaxis protein CheW [Peribacillus alkalitolerans]|uniref:chemotaxis protein CheW n=1 Tax=Peribacillus alkalitolerans TaxID=1550385 RepID=UPI0013D6525F|nr:chemotaxis protein CheW [Peribacillus alkalitolerans]